MTLALSWASQTGAWDDTPDISPLEALSAPHLLLEGNGVRAHIMHPDPENGFYRKRRFVAAGIVSRLQLGGRDLIGRNGIHSLGLICEFETPIVLPPLEKEGPLRILKIGVGTFTLDPKNPRALRDPQLETRAEWATEETDQGLRYHQSFSEPSGHGYLLTKEIRFDNDAREIILAYTLKNTGKHLLKSNHYVHNFFALDGVAIGPEIELRFPFELEGTLITEKLRNGARLEGPRLVFDPVDVLNNSATWLELPLREAVEDNHSVLRNTRTGTQVAISGDWPNVQHKIYATRNEFCPEHFITLDLPPGEHAAWQVQYRFAVP